MDATTDDRDLTDRLKAEADRLGLDFCGVAPAVAPPGYPSFLEWLARGADGGLDYLHRTADLRAHPDRLLDGVRSVVMAGFVYAHGSGPEPDPDDPARGKVARYARGDDYHEVLWRRLEALLAWLQAERPGTAGRAVADSAPLLERDFARLAGLGWIGKNTMLIGPRTGSYTLLGALLIDADLRPDRPFTADHCGTCTRCLDACPTDAFDGPYRLDAGKCISNWTIEHRGPLPPESAAQLHGWAFGCDICQEVCPWNHKAPAPREPALLPRPERTAPDLIAWLEADPAEFARSLKGTALARAKRQGLVRNAALILGKRRVTAAAPALRHLLTTDPDPVIRDAAAWALDRIEGDTKAIEATRSAHPPKCWPI